MSQNVSLWGASYSNVPSLIVPKTGGGTAQFDDTTIVSNAAAASDITNGKLAWINGVLVTGTNSGGGGGASNIVTGTFTGATAGSVLTVSIPYTGTGYPLVIAIYPSEGSYNSSGTFYKKKQRYATCCYFAAKCYPSQSPTYPSSGGSYGDTMTVVNVYKSSSSTSYSLTRGGESNRAVFVTMNPSESTGGVVTMGSNKSMKAYIANTSYGFAQGIEYKYWIIYSS